MSERPDRTLLERAETRLFEAAEDALAAGLTEAQAHVWVERAAESLRGDRAAALDEEDRDLYPHLAQEETDG